MSNTSSRYMPGQIYKLSLSEGKIIFLIFAISSYDDHPRKIIMRIWIDVTDKLCCFNSFPHSDEQQSHYRHILVKDVKQTHTWFCR